ARAASAQEAAPTEPTGPEKSPSGFADFSCAPGNAGASYRPLTNKVLTLELRADTVYPYDFSEPKYDTIPGSTEVFRNGDVQAPKLGAGGASYYKGVQARLMPQFEGYSQTTPRTAVSPGRGQCQLDSAYRYISEM